MSNRDARHTRPQLLQLKREKVVYADYIAAHQYACTLSSIGLSPCYDFDDSADEYVYVDLKVPVDRVPNTPIVIKLVYAMKAGVGVGNIFWYTSFLVAGLGDNLTAAAIRIWEIASAPVANLVRTSTGMTIVPTRIDGRRPSADIQMQIGRDGTSAQDTTVGDASLLKIIFEYTAYV